MPPSKGATDLYKKDLYGILGVNENATEKEIIKAYKKKALKYHPDKNPDNPKAAEQFQEVYEVCEILKDAASRAAYDQLRQAKKKADERTQALDSKRKKFKEDLEKREREAAELGKKVDAVEAERKLQQEILRLRREGSRLLEQEQERLREELKTSSLADDGSQEENVSVETPRVKLKWLAKKGDPGNGGYNIQNLTDILSCYGKLSALLVSSKRNGSAIVEFEGPRVDASILEETGLVENPFALIWLSGKPSASDEPAESEVEEMLNGTGRPVTIPSSISGDSSVNFCESAPHIKMQSGFDSFSCGAGGSSSSGTGDAGNDFENLVLRKMRQAEERKRLIAEMQAEDNDS